VTKPPLRLPANNSMQVGWQGITNFWQYSVMSHPRSSDSRRSSSRTWIRPLDACHWTRLRPLYTCISRVPVTSSEFNLRLYRWKPACHSCFTFGKTRFQILARRQGMLSEVPCDVPQYPRQIPG
jgi:hypothetical protein